MSNKRSTGGIIYNINKKGQEILKIVYDIESIAKGYYKSITS